MGEIGTSVNVPSWPVTLDTNNTVETNTVPGGSIGSVVKADTINDVSAIALRIEESLDRKWIDASYYSSITVADAAAVATGKTLLISTAMALSAGAITLSASLMFMQSGSISKGSASSLTISGHIVGNPMHQLFYGFAAGEVTFGTGEKIVDVWSEWWGAVGDCNGSTGNGTDCGVAINSAIKAIIAATHRPTLRFTGGSYRFTTVLNFTPTGDVTGFTTKGVGSRVSNSGSAINTITNLVWDGIDPVRAYPAAVMFGDREALGAGQIGYVARGFNIQDIVVRRAEGSTSIASNIEFNGGTCSFTHVSSYNAGTHGWIVNGIDNVFVDCVGSDSGNSNLFFYNDYGFSTTTNYFYGCSFSRSNYWGIYDLCSAGTEIYGCDIEFNNREGIYIDISYSGVGNSFTIYGGHIEGNGGSAYPQQVKIRGNAGAQYVYPKLLNSKFYTGGRATTRHIYVEKTDNGVIDVIYGDIPSGGTHLYDGGNNSGLMVRGAVTSTDGGGNYLPAQYMQGYIQHPTTKPAFKLENCGLIIDSMYHGLVIPKMTTVQRTALTGLVTGTMVYDITLDKTCFYEINTWYTKFAAAQANSTATILADLVTDFNALLAKLRTAGLLST